MNHIEKALKLAEKYQQAGNQKEADKFFMIAQRYEELLKEIKENAEKRNAGGY